MKYYAVKNGREPGIYNSWAECQKQIHGFKNASYKSFTSRTEAEEFISDKKEMPKMEHGLIAYVDGSFNAKKKVYGYGAVLIDGQQVIKRLYGHGDNEECLSSRNVAGEIFGALAAVKYAVEHPEYDGIVICYDYMGIEKWAIGEWKANKKLTQYYASKMTEYRQKLPIVFMKVEAHTGDFYNEQADQLAKKAVGIE
ncbi:ribonuclease H family protein [uncultured Catenibacterium sp.]|uniref:ribonuclease H family protein n=1 Tax=uncultured Catenibacterium sp. TaxID=286142 RepID=UPI0025D319CA|nr:ribonuclease H family protein [uncultured Catenibacterium sp.]